MKTQAATLWGPGEQWVVEDIELDPPKNGEVKVELAASGMCHSDEHVRDGSVIVENYPFIGGHEGAGVVTEVGPGGHDRRGRRPCGTRLHSRMRKVPVVRDRKVQRL